MRILAIETSTNTVSVALLEQSTIILELDSNLDAGDNPTKFTPRNAGASDNLPPGYVRKRSKGKNKTSRIFPPGASVLLAPMIKSAVEQAGVPINSIEIVAVTIGPGSFTGLRVGVVTAKALAYSIQAQIIGVNALDAIATKTAKSLDIAKNSSLQTRICAIVNAQRKQVFAGYYQVDPNHGDNGPIVKEACASKILDHQSWISGVQPDDVLTGSGLKGILAQTSDSIPETSIAAESCWSCSASGVGQLAWHQFESGKRDNLWELEPLYFRPSAAEEVRSARIDRGQTS